MTDQTPADDVLSRDQRVRVVLARQARSILATTTLITTTEPSAREIVELGEWLEGAGRDVYWPEEKMMDGSATGLPEDADDTEWRFEGVLGQPEDAVPDSDDRLDLARPFDQLSERERAGLKRLLGAIEGAEGAGSIGVGELGDPHEQDAHCPVAPPEPDPHAQAMWEALCTPGLPPDPRIQATRRAHGFGEVHDRYPGRAA